MFDVFVVRLKACSAKPPFGMTTNSYQVGQRRIKIQSLNEGFVARRPPKLPAPYGLESITQGTFNNVGLRNKLLIVRFNNDHTLTTVESVQFWGFICNRVFQGRYCFDIPNNEARVSG